MVTMKKIAIVPAYNEEKTIAEVVSRLRNFVDEIIVVNDGSKDKTAEIIKKLDVTAVTHEKNKGYGGSIRSGFQKGLETGADIFLLIDADLQHDPKEASRLIDFLVKNDCDIVIGSRFLENTSKIPLYRSFGIKLFTLMTRVIMGLKITDSQSGFRAFNRKAIEKTVNFGSNDMGASIEMLYLAKRSDLKIMEYPITCSYENVEYSVPPLRHGLQLIKILLKIYLKYR